MSFSFLGMTPRTMKLYKQVQKRKIKVTLKRLDLSKLSEIISQWIADSEQQKLERQKRARIKYLADQVRSCEPYIPKITSAYHVKKQSSVSVLQSFTSAVQSLCSPESSPEKSTSSNGYKKHSNNASHFQQRKAAKITHKLVIPSKSVKSQGMAQCIDLCSSEEEDNEVQIRFR